ncbi:hypothetical protein QBC40DRAFT_257526 [Triangularia verruculosa]|uniref:Uncharacterized protein n=1 Tax=Triangularia verruculosa TaxID=2587418 RepID=A0AAN7ASI6_9PEZI|nr:hypothetical protein QBC40DRAFT_257526 [Triangularia verruculosa]
MKLSAIALLTAIVGVMASPVAEPEGSVLEARACHHASTCSWIHGGTCEKWCKDQGKKYAGYMESCNVLTKKCCCTK